MTSIRRATAGAWLALVGVGLTSVGAVIVISQVQQPLGPGRPVPALQALAPYLAGETLHIPVEAGFSLQPYSAGQLLTRRATEAVRTVAIDLCQQRSGADKDPQRILPVLIGNTWEEVSKLGRNNLAHQRPVHAGLRNVVLGGSGAEALPKLEVTGRARSGFDVGADGVLKLRLTQPDATVVMVGDQGGASATVTELDFRLEAWVLWPAEAPRQAIRLQRSAQAGCDAGALEVTLHQTAWQAPVLAMSRVRVALFPAKGGAPVLARLFPGNHLVPAMDAPKVEDQALFDAALGQRLLKLQPDGRIAVVPADLPAWRDGPEASRLDLANDLWNDLPLDARQRGLIKRLYRDADGDYVRRQINAFNADMGWAALRVATASDPLVAKGGAWQALVAGAALPVTHEVPPRTLALFAQMPRGWGPWQRAEGARDAVRFRLPLAGPARGGESAQLLVLGGLRSLQGARQVGAVQNACHGPACKPETPLQEVRVVLEPGAQALEVEIEALGRDVLALSDGGDFRHIQRRGNQLVWVQQDASPVVEKVASKVTVTDRRGEPLLVDGALTEVAQRAGLGPLLGLDPRHSHSVGGVLARLATPEKPEVTGKLTLDLGMQQALDAALYCVGYHRGRLSGGTCLGGGQPHPDATAGAVVVDAGTGEILALAGEPLPPSDVDWGDLQGFDRMNPARSRLRTPALQHDGGADRAPGSSFKLVTALGLELMATRDRAVDALLDGLPVDELNRRGQHLGFNANAACYPAPCGRSRWQITNYREQKPMAKANGGRFGLREAIAASVNTWFTWANDLTDASLFGLGNGGVPDLLPLTPGALHPVRPVYEMAHRLGFEQSARLDGGLLPVDFAWQAWDVLHPTPSSFDPVTNSHARRQFGIGLRMQATPLQMSQVSAAIGEGQVRQPRLLMALNGIAAAPASGTPLGVRTDRIRAGMKDVVDRGTAQGAFAGRELDRLRRGLHGKTGTAPVADRNTVWFTGWLEPNTLPGEGRRLAFAVFVSHSQATGGAQSAPVVAAFLQQLKASH